MIRKWLVKLAVLTGALLVLAFIILATNFFGVFDETWTQEEIDDDKAPEGADTDTVKVKGLKN